MKIYYEKRDTKKSYAEQKKELLNKYKKVALYTSQSNGNIMIWVND